MKNWCRQHPIGFMLLYLLFYLCFFTLLERTITVPDLLIRCRLDDCIPFCKYAIVPYYLWFAWIPGTLLYLLRRAPREDFWRLCLPLFTGMTLALLFCAVVPNGVDLRPRYVFGDDIFARAVRQLYRTDTSTNVCPSIHVFNAVTLHLCYLRAACFSGPRRRPVRIASGLLCVSIVASTMLLKQHSVIDVTLGILLALALDHAATLLSREALARRERRRLPKLTGWL